MGRTFLTGGQVKDGSVQKVDLDTTTTGQAVITKVIAGTNISISSTGVDAGTGDVTVNLGGTVASDISSLQSSVSGKADSSSLATVATSGSYNDLTNKPSLFDGAYSSLTGTPSLAAVATSGSYNDLTNKPSLFSGSYADLTNKPSIPSTLDDLSDVTISSPSNTQVLQYNGTAWVNATVSGGASSLDGLSDVAITSASKGQFVVHNGTSFVNSNTIEASGAAVKPLIVKGAVSQTANLFEAQNSAGTAVVSFTNAGAASFSSTITAVGSISFGMSGASAVVTTSGTYNGVAVGRGTSTGESGLALGSYQSCGSNSMIIGWGGGGTGRYISGLSSGEVGVGTTTPGAQFHVIPKTAAMKGLIVQGAASQTANLLEVQDSSGNVLAAITTGSRLRLGTTGVAYSEIGFNSGDSSMRVTSINDNCFSLASPDNGSGVYTLTISRNTTRGTWEFSRGATNALAYNFNTYGAAGGGFGVNLSTAPGAELHVNSNAAAKKGCIIRGAASQTANLFEAQNSAGAALVAIRSDGTETITTSGSNLGLAITHNTTGQSCLGLTHNLAGTGTQYYAAFYNATPALVGSITTNGSSTTYATTSDYRLKENVVPMADGLSRLIGLPVYRFNYKERPQETVDGCLAHEVSSVVPEAVIGEKDAVDSSGMMMPQAVDYSKLVPLLVAAIKELKQKNDELESRLLTLENK